MATMSHIAEASGYSVATVSLALRNHPRVPERTRKKILAAAKRLGYRRDARLAELVAGARRKKTGRSASVLSLVVSSLAELNREPSEQKTGIYRRADELGYRIDEFALDDGEGGYDERSLSKALFARGIQGVMVYPLEPQGSLTLSNWEAFFPAASGFSLLRPRLHRVCCDYFQCASLALARLHELGYRRIGLALSNELDDRVAHLWYAGYLLHQASRRTGKIPALIQPAITKEALATWLRQHRPDVVLTAEDQWRAPILEWLPTLGMQVPGDIGYANLDIVSADRDVAGIDQRNMAIGRALVDLTVSLMNGPERGIPKRPKSVLIQGAWHPGTTVRDVT